MVPKPVLACLAAAIAMLALGSCGEPNGARGPVVLAPSSMQEALDEAARAWAAGGHAAPVLSYAGTPAQARQVIEGAPADLFVSADPQWMDAAEASGRIDPASRADLARNALVLVGPAGAPPLSFSRAAILAALGDGRLAMADPGGVPAGRYGKAALSAIGAWPALAARITASDNVRAALALVERGESPLGLVYASDARASPGVAVRTKVPAASHPPIRYSIARLAGSAHGDAAAFAAFLVAPEGQDILRAHGFTAP